MPLNNQSAHAIIEVIPTIVKPAASGASGDDFTTRPDEPMCMQIGRPAAAIADHNGSQCRVCNDGNPNAAGF
jgi:hypothetical protein